MAKGNAKPGLKIQAHEEGLLWTLYRVNHGRRVACHTQVTANPPTLEEREILELRVETERGR